jgi:hypothetical protein
MDFGQDTHKKNPPTLPMPNMIAAHAFPFACSARGRMSTRRARSTACTNSPVRSSDRNIKNEYGDFTGVDAKVDAVYGQDREPDGQNVVLELSVSVRNSVSERNDGYSRRSPCCNDRGKVSSESEENKRHGAEGHARGDVWSSPAKARLGVVGHDTCTIIS